MLTQHSNLNQAAMNVLRLWKEKAGQDLVEYALMSGFVAAAAGAIMPGAAASISRCRKRPIFPIIGSDGGRHPCTEVGLTIHFDGLPTARPSGCWTKFTIPPTRILPPVRA